MNTLYIKNGEIQLIGFETIHDKIFSEKQEIEPQQIEEIVNEHHIYNPTLASKLIKYGFENAHSFAFHSQEYYCPYVFD